MLDDIDRAVYRVDRAAEIAAAGRGKVALPRLAQQRRAKGEQHWNARMICRYGGVEGPQLYGEFVLAWISIADQLVTARIKILLGDPHTFAKRRGRRLVHDVHAAAGPSVTSIRFTVSSPLLRPVSLRRPLQQDRVRYLSPFPARDPGQVTGSPGFGRGRVPPTQERSTEPSNVQRISPARLFSAAAKSLTKGRWSSYS